MPAHATATRAASSPIPAATPAPAAPVCQASACSWLNAAPPAVTLSNNNLVSPAPGSTYSAGGGDPMHSGTQRILESSYRTDLNSVRVHEDSHGQDLARSLSARAVTYGNHIFLGPGERQSDLRLMAHETAHVLQQQAAPAVHLWAPGEGGNSYEHEAHQAADAVMRHESFNVRQRTIAPQAQRLGMSDALNFFADKANMIPGFRMFTIVIGMNPINGARVDPSPGNIVRAIVEFLPGGGLVVQALENSGVFDKVGNWVAGQLKSLGMVGSSFKTAITDFLKSLSWKDIFNLGGVWERAKSIFTTPITQLISFVKGLINGIIQFIKDAILKPIAKLAEGTEGYNLLKGVLGKDPITNEPVPRTAETLLGPLLRMIGLGDVWSKMQQANAIPRAWAWFLGTIGQLVGFVSQIPGLFIAAFKSLTIEDIILVPKAFAKIVNVFRGFVGKFVSWGVDAMFKLLEIVFDVVSPGAFGYIKKTGAALKAILKNPLPFIGNLVRAAKLGFQNFGGNFVTHLKTGLLDWLTGSLPGVYIPKSFSLVEFGKMALSILGISWAQIRAKIVKNLGPNGELIMQGLETAFDIVKALVTGGPAAAWEVIKQKLTDLKDMIVDGIIGMVKDAIVTKAIPKLIGMFIPGAGFIAAIMSIYDTVMVFVNKISKIIQVVTAFINSIVQIAAGNIGAAAARVESILAGLLALAINFLAGFAGLGKVADKIMGIINKVRDKVDKALDAAIAWIIGKAKALFARLFGKKDKKDDKGDFREKAKAELASKFKGKLRRDKIQGIVSSVYAKYQKDGLMGVVAKPVDGSKDKYEALIIASRIKVSTAEGDFDIDTYDLDLGWPRTTAAATLVAGSKRHVFGPQRNDGTLHAEENLIAQMDAQMGDVASKDAGVTNILTINITRSPCGKAPKAHDCGGKIQQFIGRWSSRIKLQVNVRAASVYGGKFRKSSRQAIQDLVKSGVNFTHWDLIAELGDNTGDIKQETLDLIKDRIEKAKTNIPIIISAGSSG